MASISADLILRLIVGMSLTGNKLSMVLHYFSDGTIVGDEAQDFVDAWWSGKAAALKAVLSLEVKIERLEAHGVLPGQVRPGIKYLSGEVGDLNEESLPSNLGGVIQFRQTEISGRHNGRVVVPGLTEPKTVDGLLTDAFTVGDFQDLAQAFKTDFSVGPHQYKLCVLQRMESNIPIVPVGWAVTTPLAQRNLATQRRRTTELREFHP